MLDESATLTDDDVARWGFTREELIDAGFRPCATGWRIES
jgi:hypothetical protein